MSWLDRVNNIKLKVTTGDGQEFFPVYKNASRSRNMNASVFNFNDIDGSLIRRGKAESMRYPVEFHFQGENNLEESERFNQASRDVRPWTMTHTIYGDVLVQPINLNFNNSFDNVTVVAGELFETIPDTYPDTAIDVQSQVLEAVELSVENFNDSFGDIETVTPRLVSTASATLNTLSANFLIAAITDIDLQNAQNKSNDALNAINTLSQDPLNFMQKTAELARIPAKFYARAQDRINVLKEAYYDMKLATNNGSSVQEKLYFESLTGILNVAMCEASVLGVQDIADEQAIEENEIVDYNTRSDVIDVAETIKEQFSDYLNTLGSFQSEIDAAPDSYTPKQESGNSLKEAVNKSTGQLLQIAVQSKQERKYTIPKDIGIIMLVHRLLGTTESAEIKKFATNNNILMDEWLQISRGREVIYFI